MMRNNSYTDSPIKWLDRRGTGVIDPLRCVSAVLKETYLGSATLTVRCYNNLDKGDLLMFADPEPTATPGGGYVTYEGRTRLFRVDRLTLKHDKNLTPCCEAVAIDALSTTYNVPVIDVSVADATAEQALGALYAQAGQLGAGDRLDFVLGYVSATDATLTKRFFHTSLREAIAEVCEHFALQSSTYVPMVEGAYALTGYRTDYRTAADLDRRAKGLERRFEYSRNLTSVAKSVDSSEVKNCVIGYGAVEDIPEGISEAAQKAMQAEQAAGYGSRLTFTDPDSGGIYVYDGDSCARFGEQFGYWVDDNETDAARLRAHCLEYLKTVKDPHVSYSMSMGEFAANTVTARKVESWEPITIGQAVQIVDREFAPELRVLARVTTLTRDLISPSTATGTVELDNRPRADIEKAKREAKERGAAQKRQSAEKTVGHARAVLDQTGYELDKLARVRQALLTLAGDEGVLDLLAAEYDYREDEAKRPWTDGGTGLLSAASGGAGEGGRGVPAGEVVATSLQLPASTKDPADARGRLYTSPSGHLYLTTSTDAADLGSGLSAPDVYDVCGGQLELVASDSTPQAALYAVKEGLRTYPGMRADFAPAQSASKGSHRRRFVAGSNANAASPTGFVSSYDPDYTEPYSFSGASKENYARVVGDIAQLVSLAKGGGRACGIEVGADGKIYLSGYIGSSYYAGIDLLQALEDIRVALGSLAS